MPEPILTPDVINHPLPLSNGQHTTLKALSGSRLVLYFYPKDHTPGCTMEGRDFSAHYSNFLALDANVFGISRDSVASHAKFCSNQAFAFPLISDPDSLLCRAFDVLKAKTMFGRALVGIVRSTFVLDHDLHILRSWRNVKVKGHVEEILAFLQTLPTTKGA